MDSNRRANEVLDSFFEHYYSRLPVNATFTGVHKYDNRLPDWSPEGLDHRVDEMKALRKELSPHLQQLEDFGRVERLDEAVAIDYALADAFLEIQLAELSGVHFLRGNPALYTGEAVFAILSLMLRDFSPATERLNAIEHRLSAIPGFLADAKRTLGDEPTPSSWTSRALDECVGAMHLYRDGLKTWCKQNRSEMLRWKNKNLQDPWKAKKKALGKAPQQRISRSGSRPDLKHQITHLVADLSSLTSF